MQLLTVVCSAQENPATEVTELLAKQGIDIRDFDYKQLGGDGFLTMHVSDYDQSLALLTSAGYNTVADETVLLRGEDRPGALAEIARSVTDAGIQIRSLTLMSIDSGETICAILSSDNAAVRRLFADRVVN